jgi:hypothetical protein
VAKVALLKLQQVGLPFPSQTTNELRDECLESLLEDWASRLVAMLNEQDIKRSHKALELEVLDV